MERLVSLPVGVIVERREIDNPWQKWRWRPVAVLTGAAPTDAGAELDSAPGATRFFGGTLELELHRKETEAYKRNLSNDPPSLYVALRADSACPGDMAYRPVAVTASPYVAEDLLEGDDIIEALPMPAPLVAWTQAFVDRHHVDEPFRKRKRTGGSATNATGPGPRAAPGSRRP